MSIQDTIRDWGQKRTTRICSLLACMLAVLGLALLAVYLSTPHTEVSFENKASATVERRTLTKAELTQFAESMAEADWKAGRVAQYPGFWGDKQLQHFDGMHCRYFYDPRTGFEIISPLRTSLKWRKDLQLGWDDKAVIESEYRRHWEKLATSLQEAAAEMRSKTPPPEVLREVLDASDLEEVRTFPYRVNAHLTLSRRDGGTEYQDGMIDFPVGPGPTFIGARSEWPGVVFIRQGFHHLTIYSENGIEICSASR